MSNKLYIGYVKKDAYFCIVAGDLIIQRGEVGSPMKEFKPVTVCFCSNLRSHFLFVCVQWIEVLYIGYVKKDAYC
jgi:hypothetical protein